MINIITILTSIILIMIILNEKTHLIENYKHIDLEKYQDPGTDPETDPGTDPESTDPGTDPETDPETEREENKACCLYNAAQPCSKGTNECKILSLTGNESGKYGDQDIDFCNVNGEIINNLSFFGADTGITSFTPKMSCRSCSEHGWIWGSDLDNNGIATNNALTYCSDYKGDGSRYKPGKFSPKDFCGCVSAFKREDISNIPNPEENPDEYKKWVERLFNRGRNGQEVPLWIDMKGPFYQMNGTDKIIHNNWKKGLISKFFYDLGVRGVMEGPPEIINEWVDDNNLPTMQEVGYSILLYETPDIKLQPTLSSDQQTFNLNCPKEYPLFSMDFKNNWWSSRCDNLENYCLRLIPFSEPNSTYRDLMQSLNADKVQYSAARKTCELKCLPGYSVSSRSIKVGNLHINACQPQITDDSNKFKKRACIANNELVAKAISIDDTVDQGSDTHDRQFIPFYRAGIDRMENWQSIFLNSDNANYDKTDGPPCKKTEYCKTAWDVTENYANTTDPSFCVNKTNGDYPQERNCESTSGQGNNQNQKYQDLGAMCSRHPGPNSWYWKESNEDYKNLMIPKTGTCGLMGDSKKCCYDPFIIAGGKVRYDSVNLRKTLLNEDCSNNDNFETENVGIISANVKSEAIKQLHKYNLNYKKITDEKGGSAYTTVKELWDKWGDTYDALKKAMEDTEYRSCRSKITNINNISQNAEKLGDVSLTEIINGRRTHIWNKLGLALAYEDDRQNTTRIYQGLKLCDVDKIPLNLNGECQFQPYGATCRRNDSNDKGTYNYDLDGSPIEGSAAFDSHNPCGTGLYCKGNGICGCGDGQSSGHSEEEKTLFDNACAITFGSTDWKCNVQTNNCYQDKGIPFGYACDPTNTTRLCAKGACIPKMPRNGNNPDGNTVSPGISFAYGSEGKTVNPSWYDYAVIRSTNMSPKFQDPADIPAGAPELPVFGSLPGVSGTAMGVCHSTMNEPETDCSTNHCGGSKSSYIMPLAGAALGIGGSAAGLGISNAVKSNGYGGIGSNREGAWCIRPGGSLTQCAQDQEGFGGDKSHCLRHNPGDPFCWSSFGCAPNDAYGPLNTLPEKDLNFTGQEASLVNWAGIQPGDVGGVRDKNYACINGYITGERFGTYGSKVCKPNERQTRTTLMAGNACDGDNKRYYCREEGYKTCRAYAWGKTCQPSGGQNDVCVTDSDCSSGYKCKVRNAWDATGAWISSAQSGKRCVRPLPEGSRIFINPGLATAYGEYGDCETTGPDGQDGWAVRGQTDTNGIPLPESEQIVPPATLFGSFLTCVNAQNRKWQTIPDVTGPDGWRACQNVSTSTTEIQCLRYKRRYCETLKQSTINTGGHQNCKKEDGIYTSCPANSDASENCVEEKLCKKCENGDIISGGVLGVCECQFMEHCESGWACGSPGFKLKCQKAPDWGPRKSGSICKNEQGGRCGSSATYERDCLMYTPECNNPRNPGNADHCAKFHGGSKNVSCRSETATWDEVWKNDNIAKKYCLTYAGKREDVKAAWETNRKHQCKISADCEANAYCAASNGLRLCFKRIETNEKACVNGDNSSCMDPNDTCINETCVPKAITYCPGNPGYCGGAFMFSCAANDNHTTNNYYGQKCNTTGATYRCGPSSKAKQENKVISNCDERWYADSNAPPGHLCEQSSNCASGVCSSLKARDTTETHEVYYNERKCQYEPTWSYSETVSGQDIMTGGMPIRQVDWSPCKNSEGGTCGKVGSNGEHHRNCKMRDAMSSASSIPYTVPVQICKSKWPEGLNGSTNNTKTCQHSELCHRGEKCSQDDDCYGHDYCHDTDKVCTQKIIPVTENVNGGPGAMKYRIGAECNRNRMCENSLCMSLYEDVNTKRCRWTSGSRGGSENDWANFKMNRKKCDLANFTNCDCDVNAPKSVNKDGIVGWPFEETYSSNKPVGAWKGINEFNQACESWEWAAREEQSTIHRLPDGLFESSFLDDYSYGKTPLESWEFIFDKEQVNWCLSMSREERLKENSCKKHAYEDGPWTLKDTYCSHGDCAISKWNKNYEGNTDPVTSHHDWQGKTITIGGLTFRCGPSSAKYGNNAGCGATKNKWYVVGSEGFDKIDKTKSKELLTNKPQVHEELAEDYSSDKDCTARYEDLGYCKQDGTNFKSTGYACEIHQDCLSGFCNGVCENKPVLIPGDGICKNPEGGECGEPGSAGKKVVKCGQYTSEEGVNTFDGDISLTKCALAYGWESIVVDCTLSDYCDAGDKCENDGDCNEGLWCEMNPTEGRQKKTCRAQQDELAGCDRDRQCHPGYERGEWDSTSQRYLIKKVTGLGKCIKGVSLNMCLYKNTAFCPGDYCSTPKGPSEADRQDCGGMCGGGGSCGVEGASQKSFYGQNCKPSSGKTWVCGTANLNSDKIGTKIDCDSEKEGPKNEDSPALWIVKNGGKRGDRCQYDSACNGHESEESDRHFCNIATEGDGIGECVKWQGWKEWSNDCYNALNPWSFPSEAKCGKNLVKRRDCEVQGKSHETGNRFACLRYAKKYEQDDGAGNYNTKSETNMQQCDNRKDKANPKNLCDAGEVGCFNNDDVKTNLFCKNPLVLPGPIYMSPGTSILKHGLNEFCTEDADCNNDNGGYKCIKPDGWGHGICLPKKIGDQGDTRINCKGYYCSTPTPPDNNNDNDPTGVPNRGRLQICNDGERRVATGGFPTFNSIAGADIKKAISTGNGKGFASEIDYNNHGGSMFSYIGQICSQGGKEYTCTSRKGNTDGTAAGCDRIGEWVVSKDGTNDEPCNKDSACKSGFCDVEYENGSEIGKCIGSGPGTDKDLKIKWSRQWQGDDYCQLDKDPDQTCGAGTRHENRVCTLDIGTTTSCPGTQCLINGQACNSGGKSYTCCSGTWYEDGKIPADAQCYNNRLNSGTCRRAADRGNISKRTGSYWQNAHNRECPEKKCGGGEHCESNDWCAYANYCYTGTNTCRAASRIAGTGCTADEQCADDMICAKHPDKDMGICAHPNIDKCSGTYCNTPRIGQDGQQYASVGEADRDLPSDLVTVLDTAEQIKLGWRGKFCEVDGKKYEWTQSSGMSFYGQTCTTGGKEYVCGGPKWSGEHLYGDAVPCGTPWIVTSKGTFGNYCKADAACNNGFCNVDKENQPGGTISSNNVGTCVTQDVVNIKLSDFSSCSSLTTGESCGSNMFKYRESCTGEFKSPYNNFQKSIELSVTACARHLGENVTESCLNNPCDEGKKCMSDQDCKSYLFCNEGFRCEKKRLEGGDCSKHNMCDQSRQLWCLARNQAILKEDDNGLFKVDISNRSAGTCLYPQKNNAIVISEPTGQTTWSSTSGYGRCRTDNEYGYLGQKATITKDLRGVDKQSHTADYYCSGNQTFQQTVPPLPIDAKPANNDPISRWMPINLNDGSGTPTRERTSNEKVHDYAYCDTDDDCAQGVCLSITDEDNNWKKCIPRCPSGWGCGLGWKNNDLCWDGTDIYQCRKCDYNKRWTWHKKSDPNGVNGCRKLKSQAGSATFCGNPETGNKTDNWKTYTYNSGCEINDCPAGWGCAKLGVGAKCLDDWGNSGEEGGGTVYNCEACANQSDKLVWVSPQDNRLEDINGVEYSGAEKSCRMPFSQQGPAMFGLKQCNKPSFNTDGKGTTAFGVGSQKLKDAKISFVQNPNSTTQQNVRDAEINGGGGCVRWTEDHKENPDDPLPEWKDEKCWYDDISSNTGQYSYSCGQCGLLTGLGPSAWSWQKGADAPACGDFASGACINMDDSSCTTLNRTKNGNGEEFPQGRYKYFQKCPSGWGCGKDGKTGDGQSIDWTDNVESEKNRGDTCLQEDSSAWHGGKTFHCGRCTDNQRSAWYEQGQIAGSHPGCFVDATIPSAYLGMSYTGQNKKSEPSFENNDMIPFCPSTVDEWWNPENVDGPMDEALGEGEKRGWWGCADWGVGSKCQRKTDGKVFRCKECGNTRKAWEVFNDPVKHGCYETDGSFGSKNRAGPLGFGVKTCPAPENNNNFHKGCNAGWKNEERCCKNSKCTSYTHCRQCPNGTGRWVFDASRGYNPNPEEAIEPGVHVDMCRSTQCGHTTVTEANCGGIEYCHKVGGPKLASDAHHPKGTTIDGRTYTGGGGCMGKTSTDTCQTLDGALFKCIRCTNDRWSWHEDGANQYNGCFDIVTSKSVLENDYGVKACPLGSGWGCGKSNIGTKCDGEKQLNIGDIKLNYYSGKNTYICHKCSNEKKAWLADDGQTGADGCVEGDAGPEGFGMMECPGGKWRCDHGVDDYARCYQKSDGRVFICNKCSDWSGGGWAWHEHGNPANNGCGVAKGN